MNNNIQVTLNVYQINKDSILESFGFKLYHLGLEFDNEEFSFDRKNGIYDIKPMDFDGVFIESIKIGNTTRRKFYTKMEKLKSHYMINSYNILYKNCSHFVNDFIKLLFNKQIPYKYSNFLEIGEFFKKLF